MNSNEEIIISQKINENGNEMVFEEVKIISSSNQEEEKSSFPQKPKIGGVKILGKKRLLKQGGAPNNEAPQVEMPLEIPMEIPVEGPVEVCEIHEIRGIRNPKLLKTNTNELFSNIIIDFFISKWHNRVIASKYSNKGGGRPNKRKTQIKSFLSLITKYFSNHKYELLCELFDTMKNLPVPEGLVHDKNYGKLKVINKIKLKGKSSEKIKNLAIKNLNKKIGPLVKKIIANSFKKLNEDKKNKNQSQNKIKPIDIQQTKITQNLIQKKSNDQIEQKDKEEKQGIIDVNKSNEVKRIFIPPKKNLNIPNKPPVQQNQNQKIQQIQSSQQSHSMQKVPQAQQKPENKQQNTKDFITFYPSKNVSTNIYNNPNNKNISPRNRYNFNYISFNGNHSNSSAKNSIPHKSQTQKQSFPKYNNYFNNNLSNSYNKPNIRYQDYIIIKDNYYNSNQNPSKSQIQKKNQSASNTKIYNKKKNSDINQRKKGNNFSKNSNNNSRPQSQYQQKKKQPINTDDTKINKKTHYTPYINRNPFNTGGPQSNYNNKGTTKNNKLTFFSSFGYDNRINNPVNLQKSNDKYQRKFNSNSVNFSANKNNNPLSFSHNYNQLYSTYIKSGNNNNSNYNKINDIYKNYYENMNNSGFKNKNKERQNSRDNKTTNINNINVTNNINIKNRTTDNRQKIVIKSQKKCENLSKSLNVFHLNYNYNNDQRKLISNKIGDVPLSNNKNNATIEFRTKIINNFMDKNKTNDNNNIKSTNLNSNSNSNNSSKINKEKNMIYYINNINNNNNNNFNRNINNLNFGISKNKNFSNMNFRSSFNK